MKQLVLGSCGSLILGTIVFLQCADYAYGREEQVAMWQPEADVLPGGFQQEISEEERKLLVWNAYHEARGEGILGIAAVTHVILNRVRSDRFPNSVVAVIKQGGEQRGRCQLSWRCDGRPDEPQNAKQLRLVRKVVEKILLGIIKDVTSGAVFYLNPYEVMKKRGKLPDIACDATFSTNIGRHFFYGVLPWKEYKKQCKNKPKLITLTLISMM